MLDYIGTAQNHSGSYFLRVISSPVKSLPE